VQSNTMTATINLLPLVTLLSYLVQRLN
jgi:hypothetical protein